MPHLGMNMPHMGMPGRFAAGGDVNGAGGMGGDQPFVGYVQGPGDGRDDLIDARLANGEFVFDAETVALLGNGSNEAGAKLLDKWREELRSHKGAALAKGKFSPDAKDPDDYLPGAA